LKPLPAIVAIMGWCEKHQRALFVIIRDKELPITINVPYRIFFLCGDVESVARFLTMGDVHAGLNFYSPEDTIDAYCFKFMKDATS